MILGVIFSLTGIGLLIALMFNLAILALPFFAGVTTARFAYETGSGLLGAILVGFLAAAATLGVAQLLLVATKSSLVRSLLVLAFAAPAAFAGYHLVLGLSRIGGAHGAWQPLLAGIGALIIGGAAMARLATPIIPLDRGLRPA